VQLTVRMIQDQDDLPAVVFWRRVVTIWSVRIPTTAMIPSTPKATAGSVNTLMSEKVRLAATKSDVRATPLRSAMTTLAPRAKHLH
jgi:hypothetical protein